MKYTPAFLLLFFVTAAIAQPAGYIRGKIINGETGAAIANASVFITNTSKGTVSNAAGEFELTNAPVGTYDLVVSCIGYETQVYSYSASQLPLNLRVEMKTRAEELEAVVIEPFEKNGWLTWGKFFLDNFIGTSSYATRCSIKNYQVLRFRNSKKKNQLTVTATEPLIIENKAMGYRIQYQLEGFVYNFKENSLMYVGYTLFSDLNGKAAKARQLKNRQSAYNGSMAQFMRSLYNNRLAADGFEVKRLVKTPNLEKERVKKVYGGYSVSGNSKDSSEYYERVLRQPDLIEAYGQSLLTADSLLTTTDASTKKLFFTDFLYIVYKKEKEDPAYLQHVHENRSPFYQRSVVLLLNGHAIQIDAVGNYYMPQDFMSYGYWNWSEKIATMLPLDYK
jgi:hypothetical protein